MVRLDLNMEKFMADINAILDKDMERLLKSLGVYDRIKNGEILCAVCGISITLDNLQVLIPNQKDNIIDYVCNNIDCINRIKDRYNG